MVTNIRDSLKVIKNKDMVLTSMDVVVNIEVYGIMPKQKDQMEYFIGKINIMKQDST